MHITINDEEFVPRHFAVCEFYGVKTCFCWDVDKLVIFPYVKDDLVVENILLTPGPVKKIKFFDNRAFLICTPQGAYKLAQNDRFALLSKNALDLGAEYFKVFTSLTNGIYIDDKLTKKSKILFTINPNATKEISTITLTLKDTEMCLVNGFTIDWETNKDLCVIAHDRRLFLLKEDTVQLIYTTNNSIMNIILVRRQDKIAGLLLVTDMDKVILIHAKDNLVFENIHLKRKMKNTCVLCAGFNSQNGNVLWIVYCDQFKTYYVRKELFTDSILETIVKEKSFSCMQCYELNVILGLLQNDLVELSPEEFESSLAINNNVNLHTDMFKATDFIMKQIVAKVKELDILNKTFMDEQDKLSRINLYTSKQRFQINPEFEVLRLCNNSNYLTLNISEKLPKNTYIVLNFYSKHCNTFCMKKVTEMTFNVKMPIKSKILSSSVIDMDLITLISEGHPWCLIQNFADCPSQNVKKKRGLKKDKTVFVNNKITVLKNLIAEKKDLNITRLSELKKTIRKDLYDFIKNN